jgi:hypothetical protein
MALTAQHYSRETLSMNRATLAPRWLADFARRWPLSKRGWLLAGLVAAAGWFVTSPKPFAPAPAQADTVAAARGELIYVPIYSSIHYTDNKQTLELAATLSIHNVNPERGITLVRADYYDTTGKLLKRYVDKPIALGPLATRNLVIEQADRTGGSGANFLVEWTAGEEVVSPIVEALMVNASSNLGISFLSPGKVIRHLGPAKN